MKGDNEMKADNRLQLIGKWPVPGPEARRKKQIFVIKPAQTLDVIHGSENHMLVSFAVSNDFIHFGLMTIPSGVLTDLEVHNGDEVFYVLEGSISVLINSSNQSQAVTKSRFEVNCGERFLIPERVSHRYLNPCMGVTKLIFGIAPKL